MTTSSSPPPIASTTLLQSSTPSVKTTPSVLAGGSPPLSIEIESPQVRAMDTPYHVAENVHARPLRSRFTTIMGFSGAEESKVSVGASTTLAKLEETSATQIAAVEHQYFKYKEKLYRKENKLQRKEIKLLKRALKKNQKDLATALQRNKEAIKEAVKEQKIADSLSQDLVKQKSEIDRLNRDKAKLAQQFQDQGDRVDELVVALNASNEEREKFKKFNKKIQKKLSAAEETVISVQNENTHLKSEFIELRSKIVDTENEISENIRILEDRESVVARLTEQAKDFQLKYEHLLEEFQENAREVDCKNKEMENFVSQIKRLESEISSLQGSLQAFESAAASSRRVDISLPGDQAQLRSADSLLRHSQELLGGGDVRHEEYEMSSASETMKKQAETIEGFSNTILKLSSHLKSSNDLEEEYQCQLGDLREEVEVLRDNFNQLRGQKEQLSIEARDLTSKISKQAARIQTQVKTIGKNKRQVQSLKLQLLQEQETREKVQLQHKRELNKKDVQCLWVRESYQMKIDELQGLLEDEEGVSEEVSPSPVDLSIFDDIPPVFSPCRSDEEYEFDYLADFSDEESSEDQEPYYIRHRPRARVPVESKNIIVVDSDSDTSSDVIFLGSEPAPSGVPLGPESDYSESTGTSSESNDQMVEVKPEYIEVDETETHPANSSPERHEQKGQFDESQPENPLFPTPGTSLAHRYGQRKRKALPQEERSLASFHPVKRPKKKGALHQPPV